MHKQQILYSFKTPLFNISLFYFLLIIKRYFHIQDIFRIDFPKSIALPVGIPQDRKQQKKKIFISRIVAGNNESFKTGQSPSKPV